MPRALMERSRCAPLLQAWRRGCRRRLLPRPVRPPVPPRRRRRARARLGLFVFCLGARQNKAQDCTVAQGLLLLSRIFAVTPVECTAALTQGTLLCSASKERVSLCSKCAPSGSFLAFLSRQCAHAPGRAPATRVPAGACAAQERGLGAVQRYDRAVEQVLSARGAVVPGASRLLFLPRCCCRAPQSFCALRANLRHEGGALNQPRVCA